MAYSGCTVWAVYFRAHTLCPLLRCSVVCPSCKTQEVTSKRKLRSLCSSLGLLSCGDFEGAMLSRGVADTHTHAHTHPSALENKKRKVIKGFCALCRGKARKGEAFHVTYTFHMSETSSSTSEEVELPFAPLHPPPPSFFTSLSLFCSPHLELGFYVYVRSPCRNMRGRRCFCSDLGVIFKTLCIQQSQQARVAR